MAQSAAGSKQCSWIAGLTVCVSAVMLWGPASQKRPRLAQLPASDGSCEGWMPGSGPHHARILLLVPTVPRTARQLDPAHDLTLPAPRAAAAGRWPACNGVAPPMRQHAGPGAPCGGWRTAVERVCDSHGAASTRRGSEQLPPPATAGAAPTCSSSAAPPKRAAHAGALC